MFFKKKVYPILPTTESDTMTFIQKLDYLEYKLAQLNEKVVAAESAISDLETSVEGKSTVTATADGSTLQTLTVDGVTYNVPQGGEVTTTAVDLESGWDGNDAVIERDGDTCILKIIARYATGGDICVLPEEYRPRSASHAVGILMRGVAVAGVAYIGIQTTGQVGILAIYGTTVATNDYINVNAVYIC